MYDGRAMRNEGNSTNDKNTWTYEGRATTGQGNYFHDHKNADRVQHRIDDWTEGRMRWNYDQKNDINAQCRIDDWAHGKKRCNHSQTNDDSVQYRIDDSKGERRSGPTTRCVSIGRSGVGSLGRRKSTWTRTSGTTLREARRRVTTTRRARCTTTRCGRRAGSIRRYIEMLEFVTWWKNERTKNQGPESEIKELESKYAKRKVEQILDVTCVRITLVGETPRERRMQRGSEIDEF